MKKLSRALAVCLSVLTISTSKPMYNALTNRLRAAHDYATRQRKWALQKAYEYAPELGALLGTGALTYLAYKTADMSGDLGLVPSIVLPFGVPIAYFSYRSEQADKVLGNAVSDYTNAGGGGKTLSDFKKNIENKKELVEKEYNEGLYGHPGLSAVKLGELAMKKSVYEGILGGFYDKSIKSLIGPK